MKKLIFASMIQPPFLSAGDRIGIIATARKISPEELQPAIDILESWGLKTVLGKNLFHSSNQFSGTDKERAADLQQMLDDEQVKAVIVARGGYGSVRIIDRIDLSSFQKKPKWIIGYSDITVLHNHIHRHCGIASLHASMALNFPKQLNEGDALSTLKRALFGEKLSYETAAHKLNRSGKAKGILTGGNLSVLYSLLASGSQVDTEGKILFLEDLDEYLYHIDRMMQALKRAGLLSKLSGLVVGGMNDMRDNTIPFGKTAEEIIRETVDEYAYPVCFDFPAGHITNNCALKMGTIHEVVVAENTMLYEI